MYWSGAEWWAWIPMSVGMIVVWGLVIWAAVRLIQAPPRRERGSSALEILDERLARGEIGVEQHRELREALTGAPRVREPAGARSSPARARGDQARGGGDFAACRGRSASAPGGGAA